MLNSKYIKFSSGISRQARIQTEANQTTCCVFDIRDFHNGGTAEWAHFQRSGRFVDFRSNTFKVEANSRSIAQKSAVCLRISIKKLKAKKS